MKQQLLSRIKQTNSCSIGPRRIDYIAISIIAFISVFGFSFSHDASLTIKQSLIFLDCLFNGDAFHFYSKINTMALSGNVFEGWPNTLVAGANYSIINYFVIGVWCLPLYILDHIIAITVPLFVYEFYVKILFVILYFFIFKVLNHICTMIGLSDANRKWTVFLFLSSPIMLFSSLMITHFDIFSLFMMTLALREYIKQNEKRFLVYSLFAIWFKPFILLAVIPLILLREKRILFIIRNVLISCSGMVLTTLIYKITDPGYSTVQKYMSETYFFMDRFFSTGFTFERNSYKGTSSYFVISFILICVISYYMKKDDKRQLFMTFALPFTSFCAFLSFVMWHPNWAVLMVPFGIFMVAMCNSTKLYLLIETVFYMFFILLSTIGWEGGYDQSMINNGIFGKLFGPSQNSQTIAGILRSVNIPISFYSSVFMGAIFSLVLIIVITAYHSDSDKMIMPEYERGLIWMRSLPILGFIGISFVYLLKA